MDSFEWNKVFAAVIASALLIMVITTISDGLFPQTESKPAFTIEVASAEPSGTAVEEVAGPSLAELLANSDVAKGAKQWAKCKACHTVDKGGKHGTGPNLFGIMGRGVGAIDEFKYSALLAESTAVWTYDLMDKWLENPKKIFKGTTMGFGGIRKEKQRADLLAYLASMSDSPLPFPAVEAAAEAVVEEATQAVSEAVAQ